MSGWRCPGFPRRGARDVKYRANRHLEDTTSSRDWLFQWVWKEPGEIVPPYELRMRPLPNLSKVLTILHFHKGGYHTKIEMCKYLYRNISLYMYLNACNFPPLLCTQTHTHTGAHTHTCKYTRTHTRACTHAYINIMSFLWKEGTKNSRNSCLESKTLGNLVLWGELRCSLLSSPQWYLVIDL